jgi:hypothetical protein
MKNIAVSLLMLTLFLSLSAASSAEEKESLLDKLSNKISVLKESDIKAKETTSAKKETQPVKKGKEAAKKEGEAAKKEAKAIKDMSKDEMVKALYDTLASTEEVMSFVPGLKKGKDSQGKDIYTYEGTRLEDLDKDKLEGVLKKVRSNAARIRGERIQRQLERTQKIQRLNTAAGGPPSGAQLPRMPQVVSPPATPKPPPSPPKVPKPPSIPKR